MKNCYLKQIKKLSNPNRAVNYIKNNFNVNGFYNHHVSRRKRGSNEMANQIKKTNVNGQKLQ